MKYLLFLLIYISSALVQAKASPRQAIDSMAKRLQVINDDTNKVHLLIRISYLCANTDPEKGLHYALKAHGLSSKLNWQPGLASSDAAMALNYAAQSNHKKAIEFNLKALKIYEQIGRESSAAGVRSNLSLIYKEQGDYPKALEYAFDALRVKEEVSDTMNIANIEENIGSIYLEQKNYPKALLYYKKALEAHRQLKNQSGIARSFGNIGIIYGAKGDHDSALHFHINALKINQATGNQYSTQINHANIGLAFQQLKEFRKALQNHFLALQISEDLGHQSSMAVNLGNIGATYLDIAKDDAPSPHSGKLIPKGKNANLQMSINYLKKAVAICKELSFTGPQIEFSKNLSDAYLLAGRHKQSLLAYKEYTELKDSIFSMQNQANLSVLETKRELEIRDKDLAIKEKQRQIEELAVAKKRNDRLIYILLIALLLLVVGIVGKRANEYWRLTKNLAMEKSTLATQLEARIAQVKKKKHALDEIAHIQSHDVRGPVATILGLSQLFNLDDPTDPENKAIIKGITQIAEQLDKVITHIVKEKANQDKDEI